MKKKRIYVAAAGLILLTAFFTASCSGGAKTQDETAATEAETLSETQADIVETAERPYADKVETVVAETLTASEAGANESPYYGLIYATVIDINGSGDSSTIYTFSDKADPDNGWSCYRYELLDVETDIALGDDVVVLFNGDIVNDYDDVSFLVVLPDGDYEIRRVQGVTTGNLMSTFSIMTDDGEEISFLKDNAPTDEGALSADSGDSVIVYYAESADEGRFPLRVYKAD